LFLILTSGPVQACREAEIEPEKGMCCLSASEFHIPPARLSIAGNPKGKHAGALSFGYFALRKCIKEMNSPWRAKNSAKFK